VAADAAQAIPLPTKTTSSLQGMVMLAPTARRRVGAT
jgi:hypothetical protein